MASVYSSLNSSEGPFLFLSHCHEYDTVDLLISDWVIEVLELLKPLPCEVSSTHVDQSLIDGIQILHSSLVAHKIMSTIKSWLKVEN